MEKTYHHIAGIDFTHCERGQCKNCSEDQQRQCERELNAIIPAKQQEATGGNTMNRIKTLRSQLGLTQAALAALIGVSLTTVSRWEQGHTSPRSGAILGSIVRIELLAGKEKE